MNFGISIFLLLLTSLSYALPPEPPHLNLERDGLMIQVSWEDDAIATGYHLHYAPYPGHLTTHESVDLGKQSKFSTTLPNGAAFFVWVTAYNADGESRYSNIEHFIIDNKVIAFLPENTTTGNQLQLGLQEAFAETTEARLEVIFVDPNDNNKLAELFFGSDTMPGYADDPNVIAVVTATTGQTLALTKYELDNPPLVISCTGTSTQLVDIDNVVVLAPDNSHQGQLIAEALSDYATIEQKKHVKYAILLNRQLSTAAYTFDAYDYMLLYDLFNGFSLQQSRGLDENGKPIVYSQLVGSFSYDGTAASMETALTTLDILQPEVVIHIGFGGNFQTLTEKRPDFLWIGSDSVYAYDTYKDKNVRVVTMQGDLKDYGYDAGGFLKEVMSAIGGSLMDRAGILNAVRNLDITYRGRTGTKGYYVEVPGSFSLFKPGPQGWVKVK